MEFEVIEKKDSKINCAIIDERKDCLKRLGDLKQYQIFCLDKESLNLNVCLYGKTKSESIEIQKQNCNKMLNLFKNCVKVIKKLKHEKIDFDGKFYAENLDKKKNNNDFMLIAMLDVKFNVKPFKKLAKAYKYSADYLDKENSLNKMCDFQDNKCTKYRDLKSDRTTGCCSNNICKFTCNAPCPTWNLACKILMCDYLIEKKGFYFTPHTVPIMKQHFSYIERAYSIGQLCRTSKKALFELWLMRAFGALVFLFAVGCLFLFI